ncbi:MAG: hypothetical protein AAF546_12330 [Verrucomicrobiota bacterium]
MSSLIDILSKLLLLLAMCFIIGCNQLKLEDGDLEILEVILPDTGVTTDEEFYFRVKVQNNATHDIDDQKYEIRIYFNGELYDKYVGHRVFIKGSSFTYGVPVILDTSDNVEWHAEIALRGNIALDAKRGSLRPSMKENFDEVVSK